MGRQTYTWNNTVLSREQVAQVLYQSGMTDLNKIAQLIPIAMRESGGRAGVHGSESPRDRVSGDRGLFQINYVHDDRLRAAGIIQQSSDLFNPLINARAALYLSNNVDPRVTRQLWGLGIMPNGKRGWVGASGDLPTPDTGAVQRAQQTGILGQPFTGNGSGDGQYTDPAYAANNAPGLAGTPAPSAAAGPGANPGSADLGLVNAYGQNQRDYYTQQAGYNTDIFNLGQGAFNLQYEELEANKLFNWALNGVYEDVNQTQGLFNTREFNEVKKNVAALRVLADRGLSNTQEYFQKQRQLEQQTLKATKKWVGQQTALAQRQYHQSVDEADLVRGEQTRKATSEATARGARTSRGFGQDLVAFNTQRDLAENQADIGRDTDLGRIGHDWANANLSYQGNVAQQQHQWGQALNQHAGQQEQFRNTVSTGQLRYDQTAKQLWAKARELAAQKTLQGKMVDIQYKGIGNQRDTAYKQYQQSHHSLQNQHTQVGMNQLRDIQTLNQQRQAAATQALLSLSPYG